VEGDQVMLKAEPALTLFGSVGMVKGFCAAVRVARAATKRVESCMMR
jgi:hypothetical protein